MKNILILATVGGFLDKFERGNVKILQEMGYTVHYAANLREPHYQYDEREIFALGVRVHHIDVARSPYMVRYNVAAFKQLCRIILENDILAIHCHTPVGGMLGRMMGRKFAGRGLKVVYTAHGFHFYKGAPLVNNTAYYLAEWVMARYTDVLVTINREDFRNALDLPLKNPKRVFEIPGVGVDLNRFTPMHEEERRARRKELGIPEGDVFFVSVGELNENKNQMVILKALSYLRESGKDISRVHYGICGDGFYEEKIQREIYIRRLEDNVKLYGYRRDVENVIGCADFSVFPTVREGLGMAGLEALAMGIPLLASRNRGTREYLHNGINGYFCNARDEKNWAAGLQKIMCLTTAQREKMAGNCRKSVLPFARERTEAVMRKVYWELDAAVEEARAAMRPSGQEEEAKCRKKKMHETTSCQWKKCESWHRR